MDVIIVVGAGELIAEVWVLAVELVEVVVAAARVLDAGMNEGVVAVHLVQMVTVSVVRKVETLVTISIEVLPPLVCVLLATGQLVTVV